MRQKYITQMYFCPIIIKIELYRNKYSIKKINTINPKFFYITMKLY